jgi:hypothetical protein
VSIWGLAGWAVAALMGAAAKALFPKEYQDALFERLNADLSVPLYIWLGVWNGFYVWKDLDHDYHKRRKSGDLD